MRFLSIIIKKGNNVSCLFLQGVDTLKDDAFILCWTYFELNI